MSEQLERRAIEMLSSDSDIEMKTARKIWRALSEDNWQRRYYMEKVSA